MLWCALGAVSQIAGTALMLAAMKERSFFVVTAYAKTEPAQTAVFGFLWLRDFLSWPLLAAIAAATCGVLLISAPRRKSVENAPSWRSAAFGLLSASFFAVASTAFRGAVVSLSGGSSFLNAAAILVLTLFLQCAIILWFLLFKDFLAIVRGRAPSGEGVETLRAMGRLWRSSLAAGFFGAFASLFWFWAFALQSAVRVRALALIEAFFAYAVSRRMFPQKPSWREVFGVILILIGVVGVLRE